jgi:hypothetical protein
MKQEAGKVYRFKKVFSRNKEHRRRQMLCVAGKKGNKEEQGLDLFTVNAGGGGRNQ